MPQNKSPIIHFPSATNQLVTSFLYDEVDIQLIYQSLNDTKIRPCTVQALNQISRNHRECPTGNSY